MFDFEKAKTAMGIFGGIFGLLGKIGRLLKPSRTTQSFDSSNSSGIQVNQGDNGRIQLKNATVTVNSSTSSQWVSSPRWRVEYEGGGGTVGNLRYTFFAVNLGGYANDVTVEEQDSGFLREFPPVSAGGRIRFDLKFTKGAPGALDFVIRARDANGKPVFMTIAGTRMQRGYEFSQLT